MKWSSRAFSTSSCRICRALLPLRGQWRAISSNSVPCLITLQQDDLHKAVVCFFGRGIFLDGHMVRSSRRPFQ